MLTYSKSILIIIIHLLCHRLHNKQVNKDIITFYSSCALSRKKKLSTFKKNPPINFLNTRKPTQDLLPPPPCGTTIFQTPICVVLLITPITATVMHSTVTSSLSLSLSGFLATLEEIKEFKTEVGDTLDNERKRWAAFKNKNNKIEDRL